MHTTALPPKAPPNRGGGAPLCAPSQAAAATPRSAGRGPGPHPGCASWSAVANAQKQSKVDPGKLDSLQADLLLERENPAGLDRIAGSWFSNNTSGKPGNKRPAALSQIDAREEPPALATAIAASRLTHREELTRELAALKTRLPAREAALLRINNRIAKLPLPDGPPQQARKYHADQLVAAIQVFDTKAQIAQCEARVAATLAPRHPNRLAGK